MRKLRRSGTGFKPVNSAAGKMPAPLFVRAAVVVPNATPNPDLFFVICLWSGIGTRQYRNIERN
jgi:hypothetical protein